jgi:hypothetical protein
MKNQNLSVTLPQGALKYGLFVKAAIDVYTLHPTVLSPTQDQYPSFPGTHTLLANIQMNDFFGQDKTTVYFGFIAVENANPANIVVAIRGTKSITEWWDDFQVSFTPCPFAPNAGNVESGFLELYNSLQISTPGSTGNTIALRETVSTGLKNEFDLGKYKQVIMAGHSLGSSLVTLYGLDMAAKNPNKEVIIYTLASPCTGDHAFVNYYNTVISESYRIYNEPDVVPKSLLLLGYSHVPVGFEVDSRTYPWINQTIACYHSLGTYLYLLSGQKGLVDASCIVKPVQQ